MNRLRVVELEVAVHLVGGDVVQPDVVAPHRLEQQKVPTMLVWMNGPGSLSELSLWDSAAKWTTASCVGHERVDDVAVGDVADHEAHPALRQLREGLAARGVGELVEDGHGGVGVLAPRGARSWSR